MFFYLLQQQREKKLKLKSGLPDGLFSNQKIPIWVNFGEP
jgi:hypothetical protein